MGIVNFKIIKDYILDKLSPDHEARLIEWLDRSEDHESLLFEAERMYHVGRGDYRPSTDEVDAAEADVMNKILDYENRRARTRRLSVLRYAAIGLVLVVGGALMLAAVLGKSKPEMVSLTADASQTVTLPDGTTVWLERGASIAYPKDFEGDTRAVQLQGEALFQVTKNTAKPFIVSSDHVSARVLGTVFSFKTQCKGNTEEVTLLEGKLEVAESAGANKVVIRPNQKVVVDKNNHTMEVIETYPPLQDVRRNGMIPFTHMSVDKIVDVLRHLYGADISIAPGVDRNQTYSGSTPYQDSVEAVLHDLTHSIPFRYRKSGSKIIITE